MDDYYKLPKNKQWLDNPFEIGGRAVDISQIGYTLSYRLRELYPINQVPAALAAESDQLSKLLEEAEHAIDSFIAHVSREVSKQETSNQ